MSISISSVQLHSTPVNNLTTVICDIYMLYTAVNSPFSHSHEMWLPIMCRRAPVLTFDILLMHLCNADVQHYLLKDMLWGCVSELVVYMLQSTFTFLTSPFRCILSGAKRCCMVFWRAPGWEAKGLLIVDFVIANSQLTQRWTTSCSEAIGTAIGSGVGVAAVLTANTVTPSLVSMWQIICPATTRNHVACWTHQSWQLAFSAALSAKRWAVVQATAAKRLLATSKVKLSYMANVPQVQQVAAADGLSSQADMPNIMLLKGPRHVDVDEQPNLLKAHRAHPSKAASKEPSVKPDRAGAKGKKAPAGPHRAQPRAAAKKSSFVADQAQAGNDAAKKSSLVADQAQAGNDGSHALAVLHQAEAGAEPSSLLDQAQPEDVGNKHIALLDQSQAGADGRTHLRLPDQAHNDSTWPALNKRARKQLRKASQTAADETPEGRDDESEADNAADLPDIPEGKDIKLETSVAVVPHMKNAKSGSLPKLCACHCCSSDTG